jgi:hypothetical protein
LCWHSYCFVMLNLVAKLKKTSSSESLSIPKLEKSMSKLIIALLLSALSFQASADTSVTLGSCDFSHGPYGGSSGGFDNAVCSFASTTSSSLTISNFGNARIDPGFHGAYGVAIDLWSDNAWTNVFTSANYNAGDVLLSSIISGPIDFAPLTTDRLRLRSDIDHGYNFHDASDNMTFTLGEVAAPAAVPEPASIALLGMGLIGFGVARRRKHSA